MADESTITMDVLQDGYWDGAYARRGDVITVPAQYVDTLIVNSFAARREPPVDKPTKGSKHGR